MSFSGLGENTLTQPVALVLTDMEYRAVYIDEQTVERVAQA